MADVIPFTCARPREDMACEVAALPYDVYSLAEARVEITRHPRSFLRIDMAEAMLPDSIEEHADAVYECARDQLDGSIDDGMYLVDDDPGYYLYRLTSPDGRSQTGVVGCASIDDYEKGIIKRHEKTKPDKEIDRIKHVDRCCAHTGPIFLAYRSDGTVEKVMAKTASRSPLYRFTADDGVDHTIWKVDDPADSSIIQQVFEHTPALYVADGHHRTASAVHVGMMRRDAAAGAADGLLSKETPGRAPRYEKNGKGVQQLASDHFLAVIFPSDQLDILDYNRVVAGLNGLSEEVFLAQVRERFIVSAPQPKPVKPTVKGTFGMYLHGSWYELAAKQAYMSSDPVSGLDVSILQDNLLAPILGIDDPRTDKRIDFIGGVRGLKELERRAEDDMTVAFALYPTSIDELFAVADAGLLMPPKSTWFEPKPRSGIFIHRI